MPSRNAVPKGGEGPRSGRSNVKVIIVRGTTILLSRDVSMAPFCRRKLRMEMLKPRLNTTYSSGLFGLYMCVWTDENSQFGIFKSWEEASVCVG